MRSKVMSLFNKFRKYMNLSNAMRLSWAIAKRAAFRFFKKGDGTERVMQDIEVIKVKEGGLVLVSENGAYKQFYLDLVIF